VWRVQRYLAAPLLLGGRKFDIRALVVIDPHYHVLWYKKARFSRPLHLVSW
jgi:hypothetical protein